MKQYELLKDLPYVKATAIYTQQDNGYYLCGVRPDFVDQLVKETVEDNPSWFRLIEDKPKEWEVISVERKGTISFWSTGRGYTEDEIKKDGRNIHSVRRLSDGEVFTVGDRIWWEHGSDEISKIELDPKYKSGIKLIREKANYGRDGGIDISIVVKLESSIKKEFVWTDQLVKEYAAHLIVGKSEGITNANEHIRRFKQSKTQPISSSKGIIEVSDLRILGNSDHGHWYEFHVAGNGKNYLYDIPNEKFHLIKSAIEKILNNE